MEGIEISLKLYCDNKSVVMYSNSNRSSTKSKHINIKFLIVMETFHSSVYGTHWCWLLSFASYIKKKFPKLP